MMMKRILGVALIATLAACGKDEEETKTPAITEATYAGTWESACTQESDGTYEKTTLTIGTDKTVKQTLKLHSDNTCTTAFITTDVYATLALAGEVDATTRKVDLSITDVKLTMNTDEGVLGANVASLCSFTDWTKGTAKSCLGKSLEPNQPPEFTSTTKIYNIFKVDGTILYVGDESKTEAQRPTTLKPAYTKK